MRSKVGQGKFAIPSWSKTKVVQLMIQLESKLRDPMEEGKSKLYILVEDHPDVV